MAITSWFDQGMTWGDNTEKPMLAIQGEAMFKALTERKDGRAGAPVGVGFTQPATGHLLSRDKFSKHFDDEVTGTIPNLYKQLLYFLLDFGQYANQNLESNWKPTGDLPDDWTISSMLTEIGDPATINTGLEQIPKSDWSIQKFKIINELLWARFFAGFGSLELGAGLIQIVQVTDPNAATAKANADALWSTSGFTSNNENGKDIERFKELSTVSGDTVARIVQSKRKHFVSTMHGPTGQSVDVEIFFLAVTTRFSFRSRSLGAANPEFDDHQIGAIVSKYWHADTTTATQGTTYTSAPLFDIDSLPIDWPVGSSPRTRGIAVHTTGLGGLLSGNHAVLKWDKPAGFKFV